MGNREQQLRGRYAKMPVMEKGDPRIEEKEKEIWNVLYNRRK